MTEDERDSALLDGYMLGQRVMFEAFDIRVKVKDDKSWDVLREIAEGRLTLAGNPAEMLAAFPDADPEAVDKLWRNANRIVAKDRECANGVFRALDRLYPRP